MYSVCTASMNWGLLKSGQLLMSELLFSSADMLSLFACLSLSCSSLFLSFSHKNKPVTVVTYRFSPIHGLHPQPAVFFWQSLHGDHARPSDTQVNTHTHTYTWCISLSNINISDKHCLLNAKHTRINMHEKAKNSPPKKFLFNSYIYSWIKDTLKALFESKVYWFLSARGLTSVSLYCK